MPIIWLGALLVIGGVVFTADRAIREGRFSGRRPRSAVTVDTLEPRQQGGGLGLAAYWPGFGMIALGAVLLLAGAAF